MVKKKATRKTVKESILKLKKLKDGVSEKSVDGRKASSRKLQINDQRETDNQNFIPKPDLPRIYLPQWETPCSAFFQLCGSIDFKDYLRLKQDEKDASTQYKAAVKIQAAFRGFLVRANMQILHESAIKIQAFMKGTSARKRYLKYLKEKDDARILKEQNEAATEIQKTWRGYSSRKNKFDFENYKKIQEKNEALKRSIEKMNDFEGSLTLSEETEGESQLSFEDLASIMSESRIAELYEYASKTSLTGKDSVDALFPEFPNIDGIIRPDNDKVKALKDAIRLLRKQAKAKELKGMEKIHHLLRTATTPGVYSDIYCNELTDIEKQMKALSFYTPPPDPRKKKEEVIEDLEGVTLGPELNLTTT